MGDELARIKTALHLMNTMLLSGERHSQTSSHIYVQANLALNKLEAHHELAQVRVKALDWDDEPEYETDQYGCKTWGEFNSESIIATCKTTYCAIYRHSPDEFMWVDGTLDNIRYSTYRKSLSDPVKIPWFSTIDEAKAAAQADYERRILSALGSDTVASDQTQAEWKKIAMSLFAALDDIDTADDIAKDNEKLYRNLVRKAHAKRFKFQELFDPDGDVSSFNQPPAPKKER